MTLSSRIKNIWNFEKKISEIYQPNSNAFDILRFVMASLVIVHHSYDLLGIPTNNFFVRFTRGQLNLGSFAVGSFFIISGFLVTQSLLNSRSLTQYFTKRFLRLFPALFVSLFLSAVVLGPFLTHQSLSDYFQGDQGTSPFRFIFLNFTLNIFGYNYNIRDLFQNNPIPYAVNGSLWTLKHEFVSYCILAGLSIFGFIKHPKLLLVFTSLVGGGYLVHVFYNIDFFSGLTTEWWVFHSVEYPYLLLLLWLFLFGSILYIYRDNIFVSTKMLVFISGVLYVALITGYLLPVWYVVFPYLLIGLALLLPMSWFSKYGDFSYGIYIYAFPVQQALVYFLYPGIDVRRFMVYSFLITFVLSVLSWHLIEKPALSLKKRFG